MYQRVKSFLQHQMHCLLEQDFDTMMDGRLLPFRLTIPTGTLVMTTRQEVIESLQFRAAKYLHFGVTQIETTVVAVNLPRGENFQAWAEYQLFCGDSPKVYSASATHYLTYRDDKLFATGMTITRSDMKMHFPEERLARIS